MLLNRTCLKNAESIQFWFHNTSKYANIERWGLDNIYDGIHWRGASVEQS